MHYSVGQPIWAHERRTGDMLITRHRTSKAGERHSGTIKYELEDLRNEVSQLDSKILIEDNLVINWLYATAKAQCEGSGARLISTGMRNNQVKSKRIIEIFPKQYLTGASSWIGLDDISNEGIWVWSDGVNETPSVIWAPGEPNGGNIDIAY
uniref:low affinity immunoglobulin epsilon Fc receptor-like n=1 Tax=Styela clava TaxID=7725 RepID=UPI001939FF3B|nr:low affinity immunoglobulin epsilon Fc receptor-like [Styela clava]